MVSPLLKAAGATGASEASPIASASSRRLTSSGLVPDTLRPLSRSDSFSWTTVMELQASAAKCKGRQGRGPTSRRGVRASTRSRRKHSAMAMLKRK
eukprot:scaffold1462_cov260-Pinguiococcus_pyrenoidosus.AAC.16